MLAIGCSLEVHLNTLLVKQVALIILLGGQTNDT